MGPKSNDLWYGWCMSYGNTFLRRFLLFFFCAAVCAAVAYAADTSENSWDSLATLTAGRKVQVVEKTLKSYEGKFTSFDSESITVSIKGANRTSTREDVLRISARKPSHRFRNALIFGTIGAVAGSLVATSDADKETTVPLCGWTATAIGAFWPPGNELIYRSGSQPPTAHDAVVPIDQEPVHKKVFDNEYVTVFDVVIPPHGATLLHRHDRDYIFVTIRDSEISNERMGEKPVHVALKDGEVRYVKGGFSHVARNLAETPFHNLTIELKNPGAAVCGIDPTPACQNSNPPGPSVMLLSTEHVIVRLATLAAGEQTPVHTHPLAHLAVAEDDLTFENQLTGRPASVLSMTKGQFLWFGDVPFSHLLKNAGKTSARLLSLEFQ